MGYFDMINMKEFIFKEVDPPSGDYRVEISETLGGKTVDLTIID